MRVLIATTAFPRWQGDPRGTFIDEAAVAVRRAGAEVRVLTLHSPGAAREEAWRAGIQVIRVPYGPAAVETLQDVPGGLPLAWRLGWGKRALFPPFFAALTAGLARHGRWADVIHANWAPCALAARLSQPVHRRPYVVTVQGSDIYQAARMPLMGGATRQGLRGAGRVFALSSDLARATTALRLPPGLVHVLPNGVDIDRFVPGEPTREPIILSVGSLIARKAVDVLIEAVAGLTNERPWRLVIIGDGGERSALEAQVARLGLGARVQFPGNQDQATVAEWMRRARVFVLPSREEGLGVVLLEALASGTPCVGSAVGGIPDVVVPAVGALVPPDDPAALTTALHAILGDDERWRAMSRAARERAEACYSWPVIARELMATYESVVEQRR